MSLHIYDMTVGFNSTQLLELDLFFADPMVG